MKPRWAASMLIIWTAVAYGQSGISSPPESASKTPTDRGAVVVPPATGTESMARQPKQVDPKMDDATADIDRKNRKESQSKRKAGKAPTVPSSP